MAINQLQIPSSGNINNTVDQSQWTSLANLGNVYQKAQQDAANKAAFAQYQQTGDPKALIGSGDMNLAQLGVTAQNHMDLLKQQAIENKRADISQGFLRNQDTRATAAEARAASKDEEDTPTWRAQNLVAQGIDPNTPEGKSYIIGGKYVSPDATNQFEIKEVDNNGVKTLMRVRKQGPEGPIAGPDPISPGNPLVGPGKAMNHDQAQAASYTDRMAKSHEILNSLEGTNQGLGAATGVASEATRDMPYVDKARNLFLTADRQKLEQAQRDFANAILRKESGAAISQSEFANTRQQYFPQPGDTEEVIAQKQQNRLTAMRGMAREAGQSYQPPTTILPPEQRKAPSSADEALQFARTDIANRVPRDQVEARLKAQGVDPALIDKKPAAATPATVTAKPSLGDFMAKARLANPGASDGDLARYWKQKYGGS